jgi:hypothetical protein
VQVVEVGGGGHAVEVLAERNWEIACGLYYRPRPPGPGASRGGHHFPFFVGATGSDPRGLTFSAVAARGGRLVGIVEAAAPDAVLAAHDFGTGESWPSPAAGDSREDVRARGVRMLGELRAANPAGRLILISDLRGDAPAHVH